MKADRNERIAKQGVALASRLFEKLNFSFREQTVSDYGIDAHAELITSDDKATGQLLGIQIKTGASYFEKFDKDSDSYIFSVDQKHVDYWLNHALPVIVCLSNLENNTIFWQPINKETAISTGKGFKFKIPLCQKIDESSLVSLQKMLTPIMPSERYTIFSTDDISHGNAKRYAFEVVINGTTNKSEIASIIRAVTIQGQKRKYHRNDLIKGLWGDVDAHVITTFIYTSAEDRSRHNHRCRSLWIDPELSHEFRPSENIQGENIGGNIIVEWNPNYNFLANLVSSNKLTKEDYFETVLPIIKETYDIAQNLRNELQNLIQHKIKEIEFIGKTEFLRNRINEIFNTVVDLDFAPYECQEMDEKFESFIGFIHDVWIYYSKDGLKKWDSNVRITMSIKQLEEADRIFKELEYEISKVR